MATQINHLDDLRTLNNIAETLNRATSTESALSSALSTLVPLMGLETGWISLLDHEKGQFHLAAHFNLPAGLHPDNQHVWEKECTCQKLARDKRLDSAYSEIHCSRLEEVETGAQYLSVHASTPLLSGSRLMGILNVAAPDWTAFNARSLALLSNVGKQIGTALERAQLYDTLRSKRSHEQEALLDFSRRLLGRLGLADLTHFLTEEVVDLLDTDACSLLMPTEAGDELQFMAAHGWRQDPVVHERRIPLGAGSGAEWVMDQQTNLLVSDLRGGKVRHWSAAWLRTEGFQAHALVPMIVEDRSIGALVINSRTPRLLTDDELRLLQLMSQQAALAVDSARLLEERTRKQQLEQELAIGQQIQLSLLPATLPTVPGYEMAILYQPAREVGGDFYDFCRGADHEDCLCIFIGDVSGKGIPAAMFMAMCRTHIRSSMMSGRAPARALVRANEMILNDSRNGLFLSALTASLNPALHTFTYANAGHDRPLLLRAASGQVEELTARGIILGAFEEVHIEEKIATLEQGDTLVLYTDGIKDALSEQAVPFGLDRLKALLVENQGASPRALSEAIEHALADHCGHATQTDDLTLLIFQRQS